MTDLAHLASAGRAALTRAPAARAEPTQPASPTAYPVTVAICTYNRAPRLAALVRALRAQTCDTPFRLLFVNNNSSDDTARVLEALQAEPGARLDVVYEPEQGIVPARNRAVEESLSSEYMLVMDDDELPMQGWIQAAVGALRELGADCAGGRVVVRFEPARRPAWLGDDLLGFLAEVDYGDTAFWVTGESHPLWTANVAYRTSLFRDGLRFDARYSRVGTAIGGGEDVAMFRTLLGAGARLRYVPEMTVEHHVEPWRLTRRYFLRLHYVAGYKYGLHELGRHRRGVLGVPAFLFGQCARQGLRLLEKWVRRDPGALRQAMNLTHACGMIAGAHARWRLPAREGPNGRP